MGAARDLHHSYEDGDGELTRAGKQHQKQRVRDRSIWRQQHSTGLTTTSNSNFDTELTLSWVSTAVKERRCWVSSTRLYAGSALCRIACLCMTFASIASERPGVYQRAQTHPGLS